MEFIDVNLHSEKLTTETIQSNDTMQNKNLKLEEPQLRHTDHTHEPSVFFVDSESWFVKIKKTVSQILKLTVQKITQFKQFVIEKINAFTTSTTTHDSQSSTTHDIKPNVFETTKNLFKTMKLNYYKNQLKKQNELNLKYKHILQQNIGFPTRIVYIMLEKALLNKYATLSNPTTIINQHIKNLLLMINDYQILDQLAQYDESNTLIKLIKMISTLLTKLSYRIDVRTLKTILRIESLINVMHLQKQLDHSNEIKCLKHILLNYKIKLNELNYNINHTDGNKNKLSVKLTNLLINKNISEYYLHIDIKLKPIITSILKTVDYNSLIAESQSYFDYLVKIVNGLALSDKSFNQLSENLNVTINDEVINNQQNFDVQQDVTINS